MNLHVINSNSQGNAYLLQAKDETLLIECGLRFDIIKKALKFDLSRVVGCLITHEHKDHSLAAQAVMNAGIDVYSSQGTFKALNINNNHRVKAITAGIGFKIGGFGVKSFDVRHDCAQPYGFLINHEESGLICFMTDTFYSPHTFVGVSHFIVEANFSEAIIESKIAEGGIARFLRNRIIQSHFSLENCKEFLRANDLSKTQTITLIHLSDGNSDELLFRKEIEELTGKTTYVADKNVDIELNKSPF